MPAPGDTGSIGIHVYVFTVVSQQPVGARHTSCTQLLWKPHGPSNEDTHIYIVTFEPREKPLPGQARQAHLSSYRGNLKNVYACVL
jgi:hypothetical protein